MSFLNKIGLNDAVKKYTRDQDKVISPSETIKKFKPRLNTYGLDVLNKIFRIDNGRLNIPVFFSVCGSDAKKIIGTKKQMGKGATKSQARASALMELAERYSFFSFYKDSNNFIIDSSENIKHDLVPFEIIAKSICSDPDDFEISEHIFKKLPMKWAKSYDLFNDKMVLIPLDWFYNINAFNGSSSGNCLEESICQGVCEVIERHVSSLVSKMEISTRIINLNSIIDENVLKILDNYISLGINIYITDFTLEMGIPSVGVLAYDYSTYPENSEIVWTAGTSTDPNKALIRALTEVAQLAGDFNSNSNYVASGLPKFDFIDECNRAIDLNNCVDIFELPNLSNDNIKIEIESCVRALNDLKKNTFVVDMTHPIIDIPTSYTIISGTHFRERANEDGLSFFLAKLISNKFTPEVSIKYLKRIKKVLPKKYFLYFYIGQCYAKIRKYDIAIANFYKALSLSFNRKDESLIYLNIAIVFKNIEKYYESIQMLKLAESIDDKRVDVHNLKGYCYFMLGKYKMSIDSFERVSILDPSSAINYFNISMNYKKLKNKNKENYYYKLALSIDPLIELELKN